MLKTINWCCLHQKKSANKKVKVGNRQHKILELNEENFNCFKGKINYAIFSAGSEVSKLWAGKFADVGAVVIDNSSAFRRCKSVPLVVPEVNGYMLFKNSKKIIVGVALASNTGHL